MDEFLHLLGVMVAVVEGDEEIFEMLLEGQLEVSSVYYMICYIFYILLTVIKKIYIWCNCHDVYKIKNVLTLWVLVFCPGTHNNYKRFCTRFYTELSA